MMTSLKEKLWNTLEDLRGEEFKQLKWLLQQADIMHTIIPHLEVHPAIPVTRLERADRQDTVVQMVQIYGPHGALEVTRKVLIKINRNDLVQQLPDIPSAPKGTLWEFIIMRCYLVDLCWSPCNITPSVAADAADVWTSSENREASSIKSQATPPHLVTRDSLTEGKGFV